MYDKKIAYLHYMKNGGLLGNAGHVKIMFRGNAMSMEIYVRDMQMLPGGYYQVEGLGESKFTDKIHMERGHAVYKKRLEADKSGQEPFPYGVRIGIGENEYLEAVWQSGKKQGDMQAAEEESTKEESVKGTESTQEQTSTKEQDAVHNTWWAKGKENAEWKIGQQDVWKETWAKEENEERNKVPLENRIVQTDKTLWTDKGKDKDEKSKCIKKESQKEKQPNNGKEQWGNSVKPQNSKLSEMLTFSVPIEAYEDKWKELCKKFEVVHPFGNREEYISIAPKDFIIFPEKYQNLVNNSFLLHGYYNYQHIILGKKEEGGKNIYYLGVPGVYYEREKMVAIMFGFEGFECGDKKANNGGFGYYMRRVEL